MRLFFLLASFAVFAGNVLQFTGVAAQLSTSDWVTVSSDRWLKCTNGNITRSVIASGSSASASSISEGACASDAWTLASRHWATPSYVITEDRTLCIAMACNETAMMPQPLPYASPLPPDSWPQTNQSIQFRVPLNLFPLCTRESSCGGGGDAFWDASRKECLCRCDLGRAGVRCDGLESYGESHDVLLQLARLGSVALPFNETADTRPFQLRLRDAIALATDTSADRMAIVTVESTNDLAGSVVSRTLLRLTTDVPAQAVKILSKTSAIAEAVTRITNAAYVLDTAAESASSLPRSVRQVTEVGTSSPSTSTTLSVVLQRPMFGTMLLANASIMSLSVFAQGIAPAPPSNAVPVTLYDAAGAQISYTAPECLLVNDSFGFPGERSELCRDAVTCSVTLPFSLAVARVEVVLPAIAQPSAPTCPTSAVQLRADFGGRVVVPTLDGGETVTEAVSTTELASLAAFNAFGGVVIFGCIVSIARVVLRVVKRRPQVNLSVANAALNFIVGAGSIVLLVFGITAVTSVASDQSHVVVVFDYPSPRCFDDPRGRGPSAVVALSRSSKCEPVRAAGREPISSFTFGKCDPTRSVVSVRVGATAAQCETAGTFEFETGVCYDRIGLDTRFALFESPQHLAFGCLPVAEADVLTTSLASLRRNTLSLVTDASHGEFRVTPQAVAEEDAMLFARDTLRGFIGGQRFETARHHLGSTTTAPDAALVTLGPSEVAPAESLIHASSSTAELRSVTAQGERPSPTNDDKPTNLGVDFARTRGDATSVRYASAARTTFDVGSIGAEFTVTFWVRMTTKSQGVILAVVDDVFEPTTMQTPVVDVLANAVVLGDVDRPLFPQGSFSVYFSLVAKGPQRQVVLVFARAGELPQVSTWMFDGVEIPTIFDGAWHHLAFSSVIGSGVRIVSMFVDGSTRHRKNVYRECIASTIPPVDLLATTRTFNVSRDFIIGTSGAVHIGAFNGALFGVEMHDTLLSDHEVLGLTTPKLREAANLQINETRAYAGFMLFMFALFIVISATQIAVELRERRQQQQQALEAAKQAGSQGEASGSLVADFSLASSSTSANVTPQQDRRQVSVDDTGVVLCPVLPSQTVVHDDSTDGDDLSSHLGRGVRTTTVASDSIERSAILTKHHREVSFVGVPPDQHDGVGDDEQELSTMVEDGVDGSSSTKKKDQRKERSASQKAMDQKELVADAATSGGGGESSPISELGIIIPIVANVIQSMALYFSTFSWPIEMRIALSLPFGWIAIDISFLFPNIPLVAAFITQYTMALVLFLVLYTFAKKDNRKFNQNVVVPLREVKSSGKDPFANDADWVDLSAPQPKKTTNPTPAPPRMFINSNEVIGFVSRLSAQHAAHQAYRTGVDAVIKRAVATDTSAEDEGQPQFSEAASPSSNADPTPPNTTAAPSSNDELEVLGESVPLAVWVRSSVGAAREGHVRSAIDNEYALALAVSENRKNADDTDDGSAKAAAMMEFLQDVNLDAYLPHDLATENTIESVHGLFGDVFDDHAGDSARILLTQKLRRLLCNLGHFTIVHQIEDILFLFLRRSTIATYLPDARQWACRLPMSLGNPAADAFSPTESPRSHAEDDDGLQSLAENFATFFEDHGAMLTGFSTALRKGLEAAMRRLKVLAKIGYRQKLEDRLEADPLIDQVSDHANAFICDTVDDFLAPPSVINPLLAEFGVAGISSAGDDTDAGPNPPTSAEATEDSRILLNEKRWSAPATVCPQSFDLLDALGYMTWPADGQDDALSEAGDDVPLENASLAVSATQASARAAAAQLRRPLFATIAASLSKSVDNPKNRRRRTVTIETTSPGAASAQQSLSAASPQPSATAEVVSAPSVTTGDDAGDVSPSDWAWPSRDDAPLAASPQAATIRSSGSFKNTALSRWTRVANESAGLVGSRNQSFARRKSMLNMRRKSAAAASPAVQRDRESLLRGVSEGAADIDPRSAVLIWRAAELLAPLISAAGIDFDLDNGDDSVMLYHLIADDYRCGTLQDASDSSDSASQILDLQRLLVIRSMGVRKAQERMRDPQWLRRLAQYEDEGVKGLKKKMSASQGKRTLTSSHIKNLSRNVLKKFWANEGTLAEKETVSTDDLFDHEFCETVIPQEVETAWRVPHGLLRGKEMLEAYEEALEEFQDVFVSTLRESIETFERVNEFADCVVVQGRFQAVCAPDAAAQVKHTIDEEEGAAMADSAGESQMMNSSQTGAALWPGLLRDVVQLRFCPETDDAPLLSCKDGETATVSVHSAIRCPIHKLRLMNDTRDHRQARRSIGESWVYRCLLHPRYHASARLHAEMTKSADEVALGCNTLDFFVCPMRTCNVAICQNCMEFRSRTEQQLARVVKFRYMASRLGALSIFGIVILVLVQSLYLPTIRSAVATCFCHSSLSCSFPKCYEEPTATFLSMSLLSFITFVHVGAGLVLLLFNVAFWRKVSLIKCGVFEPEDFKFPGQGRDMIQDGSMSASAILSRSENNGSFANDGSFAHEDSATMNESFFSPTGRVDSITVNEEDDVRYPRSFLEMLLTDVDEKKWKSVVMKDRTMFKAAYHAYEFRYMASHGALFLFKILLVVAVLYLGEPNSLTQLVAVGTVELLQLIFFVLTSPFVNPWIDTLSKSGCLHQVGQIGLLGLYRADISEDPNRRHLAWVMLGLGVAYLALIVLVITFVVIIPVYRIWREQRLRREQELENARQRVRERQARRLGASMISSSSRSDGA